jgi:hypothetical protein
MALLVPQSVFPQSPLWEKGYLPASVPTVSRSVVYLHRKR